MRSFFTGCFCLPTEWPSATFVVEKSSTHNSLQTDSWNALALAHEEKRFPANNNLYFSQMRSRRDRSAKLSTDICSSSRDERRVPRVPFGNGRSHARHGGRGIALSRRERKQADVNLEFVAFQLSSPRRTRHLHIEQEQEQCWRVR